METTRSIVLVACAFIALALLSFLWSKLGFMIVFVIVLVCIGSAALYLSGMIDDNTTTSTPNQVNRSVEPTTLNRSPSAPSCPGKTGDSVTTTNNPVSEGAEGGFNDNESPSESGGSDSPAPSSELYAQKQQIAAVNTDSAKSKYVFGALVTNELNKLPNAELTRRAVPREGIDAYRRATSTMHVTSALTPRGTANERPNDSFEKPSPDWTIDAKTNTSCWHC